MNVTDLATHTEHWSLTRKYIPHLDRVLLVKTAHGSSANVQAALQYELNMFRHSENRWLLQPLELYEIDQQQVLLLEDFPGVPLHQFLTQPLLRHQFLTVALEMVNACIHLHQQGYLYQQLNPAHIFVHPSSLQVKLMTTAALSKWKADVPNNDPMLLNSLEELPYIAPEQTGRLQLEVDERTDLYALGAIFYEMLTLQPPFNSENSVDLVFDILTKKPDAEPLQQANVPEVVQLVIAKLLEKNPAGRYQSALGLKEDLRIIQQQVDEQRPPQLVELGRGDRIFHPKPSTTICGRDEELAILHLTFDKVINGEQRMVYVQGPSGSGKSTLVHELKQQVVLAKGYFLESKFDQLQQQQAIDTMLHPLRQLLKQVYFEGEQAIRQLQQALQRVDLMITEGFLTLLPELRSILAKDTVIMEEDVEYTLQKNVYVFASIQKVLRAFANERRPIVWFVDDLQWADHNSLDMLKRLYEQHESGYFLMVTTVRDEEQKIVEQIGDWQQAFRDFEMIKLRLLREEDVHEWLRQSLFMPDDVSHYLARQLFHFTQGNPLFMKEVFRMIVKNRALYFDLQQETWQVNDEALAETISKKEILDFIASRIGSLPHQTQSLLQFASCFGRQFDLHLLVKLSGLSRSEVVHQIEELVEQGFVVTKDRRFIWATASEDTVDEEQHITFQFVHDRIQQTAYEALHKEQRQEIHYEIGKLMFALNENTDDRENLTAIVRQFNYCKNLLQPPEQRRLAIWNYTLGIHAKTAGLFEHALKFFEASRALLPTDHWYVIREESVQIYTFLGECEFLVGEYEESELHIKEALEHAETVLEKLKIYKLMSFLYMESEEATTVIEAGFLALELCNMKIAREPTKLHVAKEALLLKWEIKKKSNDTLLKLPPITNKEIDVLIQIIINITSGTFRLNANLTGILLLRVMRLQLKYGAAAEGAIVYMNYALMLAVGFNDIKQATRFGQLALDMADNQNSIYVKARTYFIYGVFLDYWTKDYESSVRCMRTAQQYAEQYGLNYVVTASSCFICTAELLSGQSLKSLYESLQYEQLQFRKRASVLSTEFLAEFQYWVEELRRSEKAPQWDTSITLRNDEAVIAMHYTLRLQMSYLFYEPKQAIEILAQLKQTVKEVYPLPNTPLYYLYRSLWQFDFMNEKAHIQHNRQYHLDIKESIRKFKNWSKTAPHNFEHFYMLLLAENCRMRQLDGEAMLYYDRALQLAKINQFEQDVALIYERAAKFYGKQRDHIKAKDYISRGIEALQNWGAPTIVDLWEERYEAYMQVPMQQSEIAQSFDVLTVLETTQSLAKEIRMEDLLQKLLFSLLKHANATSGYFMRYQKGQLRVVAQAQAEYMKFTYYEQPAPIAQQIEAIAEFVLQCDEAVLIPKVSKSPLFTNITTDAKSIVCLPVHHKGEVMAVLYLENTLLHNAFSTAQLELIKMISTQIAVSIDNAEVYEDLEQRVAERTQQFGEMNLHLKLANERLERNEIERKKLFQAISHELRSPITSTLGYIEAMLDGVVTDPQQQQQYLLRSKERLLSLNKLIQDLFDLAKLEAGRIDYALTKVSVRDLYDKVLCHYEDDVERAGLSYEVVYAIEHEAFVLIDLARIEQVITNMVMNAIKYTNQGTIKLIMSVQGDEFCCTVEDSGIGIPAMEVQFIFDSYYSASNIKSSDSHGIGLAICKQIIEQHNGKIYVESIEQQGSRFSFTIPLMKP